MQVFPKILALLGLACLFANLALSAAINTSIQAFDSAPSNSPPSGTLHAGTFLSGPLNLSSSDQPLDQFPATINVREIGINLPDYQSSPENENFQIPPYALINRDGMLPDGHFGMGGLHYNPTIGGQGLECMFTDLSIWTAMNAGYQQLLFASLAVYTWPDIATRDQYADYANANFPRWQRGAQIIFPNELRADQLPRYREVGQYGPLITQGVFEPALWPTGQRNIDLMAGMRIFTFPILVQGFAFDGTTAPGPYRVVFNERGQYLGISRLRITRQRETVVDPTKMALNDNIHAAKLSWLAPVNRDGTRLGQFPAGREPYPGTPATMSSQRDNWVTPFNWLPLDDFAPIYSAISYQASHLRSMVKTIGNSSSNANDTNENGGPSNFPFTPIYQDNFTDIGDQKTGANGLNCDTAFQYVNLTYDVVCETIFEGRDWIDFRIFATGIGGDSGYGWCQGIIDNIGGQCGGNANFRWQEDRQFQCGRLEPGDATLYHDWTQTEVSPKTIKWAYGMTLWFRLEWPWAARDADHRCVQKAIELGSCLSHSVNPTFPAACREQSWFNASLTEFDWFQQGPPVDKN